MIKTKQRSIRSFIIFNGDNNEIITLIESNYLLLKDLLIIFEIPVNSELLDYLQSKDLVYLLMKNNRKEIEKPVNFECSIESLLQNNSKIDLIESNNDKNDIKELILHKNIRSGEEIINDCGVCIFGRLNDGAVVQSGGSVSIFGRIDGNIFCEGEFVIIGELGKGNILFDGQIIDREEILKLQKNNKQKIYTKIYKKQGEIYIENL